MLPDFVPKSPIKISVEFRYFNNNNETSNNYHSGGGNPHHQKSPRGQGGQGTVWTDLFKFMVTKCKLINLVTLVAGHHHYNNRDNQNHESRIPPVSAAPPVRSEKSRSKDRPLVLTEGLL